MSQVLGSRERLLLAESLKGKEISEPNGVGLETLRSCVESIVSADPRLKVVPLFVWEKEMKQVTESNGSLERERAARIQDLSALLSHTEAAMRQIDERIKKVEAHEFDSNPRVALEDLPDFLPPTFHPLSFSIPPPVPAPPPPTQESFVVSMNEVPSVSIVVPEEIERKEIAEVKEEFSSPLSGCISSPAISPCLTPRILRKDSENDDHKVLLAELVSRLSKRAIAAPFREPVSSEEVEGYDSVILRPTDLSSIMRRIQNNEITTALSLRHALWHLFANALVYNQRGTPVWGMAAALQSIVRNDLEKIDNLEKSHNDLADFEPSFSTSGPSGRSWSMVDSVVDGVDAPVIPKRKTGKKRKDRRAKTTGGRSKRPRI